MEINHFSVLFEVVVGNDKKLSYGLFEPYQFYSYFYFKEKIIYNESIYKYNFKISETDKSNIIIEYIELLLKKSGIIHDSVNLISILSKTIDEQFLNHFDIVMNQITNPDLKIECDKEDFILFDDSDYELDEEEYLCDLRKYSSYPEFQIVTECFCDLYCLPKDFSKAREKLVEALYYINEETKNGGPDTNDFFTEEDKIKYMNSIPDTIVWLTQRIKELELITEKETESIITDTSKINNVNEKIKFYKYVQRNNLVDKKECLINICNQLLRKEKLNNPEKLRYNLVIKDYTYNKTRDGIKHLEIKFSNVIKDIEGTYKLEKKGAYGSYGYYTKENLEFETKYDQEVLLDQEYLKQVFLNEVFYELVGHSSGVDPDEPGYYDE